MESGHLFERIPAELPSEAVEVLTAGGRTRIERIVSKGHSSPADFWYDQDEDEWVLLLKGAARLRFEQGDGVVHMQPGSYVHIAAHERHRVEWTLEDAETVWLAVFYEDGPRLRP